ncbi:uncharacterized protein si:dkey-262k9.2 isoform X2 [Lampris incognitus]|uniref:uncharacterized protein si:dkey-262k9.2 isoform X2 n=1 Tax=Lampris incognitus TaxID=2546036 RepID=UPI0024B49608|nr:uncharacterized protein si:dkey-262k9.2 isoform X2 [Lampris incognitus]
MMRLLFLCLLIPAARVSSEEGDGSGGEEFDDEDFSKTNEVQVQGAFLDNSNVDLVADKTTGVADSSGQLTLIVVVVVAVSVVALTVAVIIVVLVRRRKHNQQQGIYTVPTEQGQKGAV